MKEDVAVKWMEALRSGEYYQGQSCLRDAGKFCCLGVLTDLYIEEKNLKWDYDFKQNTFIFNNEAYTLHKEVQEWSGMKSDIGSINTHTNFMPLTERNDKGTTFEEIADVIEKHWQDL